jgi:hypothetical protein
MVNFPYNTTDFAFTLEDSFIEFSTENEDTYFDLKVTITYFDFFSEVEKEKVLEYKIPLLNQAQSFNVGRKIHRYLASLTTYTNTFGFMYKTAKVTFIATEFNIADDSEASTDTLTDVQFIAGEKPKLLENNIALLSNNTNYERITEKGLFIVHFLLPIGSHVLKLNKNGSEAASENIVVTEGNNVFSKKITAENFNATKGDVFNIKIDGTSFAKTFVIFPNNISSKLLIFIDKFKLFRVLECTGHFSFPDEYSQITHTYKQNLVEVLEIVDTKEINKFNINTGWVLKTDTETISSISKAKKVFLIENDTQVLALVPIAKKLTKEDSEAELYEYDLEFQINKQ